MATIFEWDYDLFSFLYYVFFQKSSKHFLTIQVINIKIKNKGRAREKSFKI